MRGLCCAVIAVFSALSAIESTAENIRVATFNVNWQHRQPERLLDAIRKTDADVLCLQETTPVLERFLREKLGSEYLSFETAGHRGRYGAERFVIASRYELHNVTYHPPVAGLFGFLIADCRVDGRTVRVANVHLHPFLVRRNSGIQEALRVLESVEEIHAAEVRLLLEAVEGNRPTLIMGDFNSLSTFVAPRQLADAGFVDSFAAFHTAADTVPTWRFPTRPIPLALRIDYIFHSKHFRTVRSQVLAEGGSDHFPVVSELVLNSE